MNARIWCLPLLAAPWGARDGSSCAMQLSGRLGVSVAAYAHDDTTLTLGLLVVDDVPEDAEIVSAWLYASDWYLDLGPSATFADVPLGPTSAFASDPAPASGPLYAFRWDVTHLVDGNGAYFAVAAPFNFNYGMALVVIYSHESLPPARVTVIDRPRAVGEVAGDVDGVRFPDVREGPAELWIYTQADTTKSTGETIYFNEEAVGGPLDGQLDGYASLLHLEVDAEQGGNRLRIETVADLFGWHLSVLRR